MALEQALAQNLPQEERKEFLYNNCDGTEKLGYMRQFTEEETAIFKDELANISIDMADIEQEIRDVTKNLKSKLEPLKIRKKALLSNIKQKAEYVDEECYKFLDYAESKAGYYAPDGKLVSTRPLRPDERQRNIFQPLKTGTHE